MIATKQQTIPKGWGSAKLGDLCSFEDGLKVRTSSNDDYLEIGDVDIFNKKYNVAGKDKKTIKGAVRVGKNILLISKVRPTRGAITITNSEINISPAFCRLNIPNKFFYYIVSQDQFLNYLGSQSKGSTYPTCKDDDILGYDLIYPIDSTEQRKIADILSTIDDEIQKTDQIIFQTENLKNEISQHLFTKGIGHDKFQKTKIGDIPKDWSFLKMKDVCTVRQGLQIPISKRFKDAGENRYKYITLKNLKDDTYEYIESPKESVICKRDDVLMTRTGNTGVVVTDVEGVFHNNFFLIDFDRKIIDKNYLVYYLRSEPIKKLLLERAGTTTIPDLNHGAFYGIHFLLPDITEQKKISDILSSIDNKISFNKEVREKLTKLKRGLMSDLLSRKVFSTSFLHGTHLKVA